MRLSLFRLGNWSLPTAIVIIFAANAAAQSIPQTMKAVVAHQYGGPEVLKYEDIPVPQPKENEMLVRVIASGVNPADPLIVSGKYAREFGTHLPLVPGYDIAGAVVKTGPKLCRANRESARREGDRHCVNA